MSGPHFLRCTRISARLLLDRSCIAVFNTEICHVKQVVLCFTTCEASLARYYFYEKVTCLSIIANHVSAILADRLSEPQGIVGSTAHPMTT